MDKQMTLCALCDVSADAGPAWNQPLLETPHFVVVPSLGSLVEGWVLLLPKKHFICFGEIPDDHRAEMQFLLTRTVDLLRNAYGDVCLFEHGPSGAKRCVGCGVDHAHLHLVPLSFDLLAATKPLVPEDACWKMGSLVDCRSAFRQGEDYLYIEQPIGCGTISVHRDFGSQVFRRAIAESLGIPERFNWREFDGCEAISRTISRLRERMAPEAASATSAA